MVRSAGVRGCVAERILPNSSVKASREYIRSTPDLFPDDTEVKIALATAWKYGQHRLLFVGDLACLELNWKPTKNKEPLLTSTFSRTTKLPLAN